MSVSYAYVHNLEHDQFHLKYNLVVLYGNYRTRQTLSTLVSLMNVEAKRFDIIDETYDMKVKPPRCF